MVKISYNYKVNFYLTRLVDQLQGYKFNPLSVVHRLT